MTLPMAVCGVLFTTLAAATPPAPAPQVAHLEACQASWYGPGFHGRPTASGETFDQDALTAAHRTLELGTVVTVTRSDTGAQVDVTVNDRGPFAHQDVRCLDLSRAAFARLGDLDAGTLDVTIQAR